MAQRGETCNPSLECPLYPNCYEDTHHKAPRRLGKLALQAGMDAQYRSVLKDYITHPMNHIEGCRWKHATELDRQTSDRLPELEVMLAELAIWNTASA